MKNHINKNPTLLTNLTYIIYVIGMQRLVILEAEPWGLPTSLKILPQYLETAGYERHAIGKWHLGFCEEKYTPTFRGFESFVGFYQGHIDYFSHESKETVSTYMKEP